MVPYAEQQNHSLSKAPTNFMNNLSVISLNAFLMHELVSRALFFCQFARVFYTIKVILSLIFPNFSEETVLSMPL